jgi:ligand-binding SRPBCC domain-containing protein
MSRHVLERSQIIPGEPDTVFAFFKDPLNLEEITPPWLGFRITYVSDREVRQGTRIEYRLKWQGIPMGWTTLISEYEENVRFADTMTRGPYRLWHHVHTFEPVSEGVLMRDRVEYELPLGPLGDLAHALLIRRQLNGIFDYRRERIAALFSD